MKRVFKYDVPFDNEIFVWMPAGASVLTVQVQGDGRTTETAAPKVWALVDDAEPMVRRRFFWRGTGHPADGVGRYVGTVQVRGGALIFHLFEAPDEG